MALDNSRAEPTQSDPSDTGAFFRQSLQRAEYALKNALMALTNPYSQSTRPYLGDTVTFSREGLRSISIALNHVRMALANTRAPFQQRQDWGSRSEPNNSDEANSEAPTSARSFHDILAPATRRNNLQRADLPEPGHSVPAHIIANYTTASRSALNNPSYEVSTPEHLGSSAADYTESEQCPSEPNITTQSKKPFTLKRKLSPASDDDKASGGRGSKFQKTDKRDTVASHEEARDLLEIVAINHVTINGRSVQLVTVPYDPRAYSPNNYGGSKLNLFQKKFTRGHLRDQGFKFPQNGIFVMQEMARLVYTTNEQSLESVRRIHKWIIVFFPSLFGMMLSQRRLYTRVTNHATKRAFFFHIHQMHYSSLAQQGYKGLRKAGKWAELEVDLLLKVIDTLILARESCLQDLVAMRNAASMSKARRNLQHLDYPGRSSLNEGTNTSIEAGMDAHKQLKREPGTDSPDVCDLDVKPEPDDWDDVRLRHIPNLNDDNNVDSWLDDLVSEDEGTVSCPPPVGREFRAARKTARAQIAGMRMRNAVDRWIRFVRVDLGRSEGTIFPETPSEFGS